jgi:imidazolonepropionase-like amidohydrolase
MLARAGSLEVLTMALQGGAHMMGREDEDIGSIEVGEVADLVVVNVNPLNDIKGTTNIALEMKGGVFLDANTLDEIWPAAHPDGTPPWAGEKPYACEALRAN